MKSWYFVSGVLCPTEWIQWSLIAIHQYYYKYPVKSPPQECTSGASSRVVQKITAGMPNSAWHLRKYSSGARYGMGQADSEEGTRKRDIQNTKLRTGKTLQISMFRCVADHPETHLALCLQPPVEGPHYRFMSVVWPFTFGRGTNAHNDWMVWSLTWKRYKRTLCDITKSWVLQDHVFQDILCQGFADSLEPRYYKENNGKVFFFCHSQ